MIPYWNYFKALTTVCETITTEASFISNSYLIILISWEYGFFEQRLYAKPIFFNKLLSNIFMAYR
jgi:hypothetical protein